MRRVFRASFVMAVAVPGLFVGVVVAAAALPTSASNPSQSAGTATPSAVQRAATARLRPTIDGKPSVRNVALSSSASPVTKQEKSKKPMKEQTSTTIVSINPPTAQGSTTSVTIVASVRGKGGGPAPTGSVTFGFYTVGQANGGPTSGVLGTSPLIGGEATFVASPGPLPLGGPQNGSIIITATYSGDHFNRHSRASIIYYVTASCPATSWPAASAGFPQVNAGGPEGYYLGQSNGWFTVYVTHPIGAGKVVFTGTVTAGPAGRGFTDGLILDVSSTKNEGDDTVTLVGSNELKFKMVNGGDLDGFTFYAGCGSMITFQLSIAGNPALSSSIFLGATGRHPAHNPLVLERR
jgi:hypothetical protein